MNAWLSFIVHSYCNWGESNNFFTFAVSFLQPIPENENRFGSDPRPGRRASFPARLELEAAARQETREVT